MFQLKLASCMAENTESFCQSVACYIENRIRVSTRYVTDVSWQERERLFDHRTALGIGTASNSTALRSMSTLCT
jgi:hypothetical protein